MPEWLTKPRRLLARYCPTDLPVVVRMVDRIKWWADTERREGHYVVRLCREMDEATMLDTLAHEWAHAMTWRKTKIDHGPAWGKAYSRCYRVVVDGWRPIVKE